MLTSESCFCAASLSRLTILVHDLDSSSLGSKCASAVTAICEAESRMEHEAAIRFCPTNESSEPGRKPCLGFRVSAAAFQLIRFILLKALERVLDFIPS